MWINFTTTKKEEKNSLDIRGWGKSSLNNENHITFGFDNINLIIFRLFISFICEMSMAKKQALKRAYMIKIK